MKDSQGEGKGKSILLASGLTIYRDLRCMPLELDLESHRCAKVTLKWASAIELFHYIDAR